MDGALTTSGPREVDRLIEVVRRLKPEIDAVRDELEQLRRMPPGLVVGRPPPFERIGNGSRVAKINLTSRY
jgi:hypothetical protein